MRNKNNPVIPVVALVITCAFGGLTAGETASPAWARTASGTVTTSTTPVPGASRPERTVEVRLTEYAIEMPLHLNAGRTLFKVTNVGEMFHRFEIEGKGIEKEIEPGVDAGQTKTLVVDLEPGSYEVYCPVRGHKKAGMFLEVHVT